MYHIKKGVGITALAAILALTGCEKKPIDYAWCMDHQDSDQCLTFSNVLFDSSIMAVQERRENLPATIYTIQTAYQQPIELIHINNIFNTGGSGISVTDEGNIVIVGGSGLVVLQNQANLTQWQYTRYSRFMSGFFRTIKFVQSDLAYAVGDSGIATSHDNGQNWERYVGHFPQGQISNYSYLYHIKAYDVAFIDDKRGIVVGDQSTILYTFDGGKTWFPGSVPFTKPKAIQGVVANSQGQAWAIGSGGLLASQDSGKTWEIVHTPSTYEYDGLGIALAGQNRLCFSLTNNVYCGATDGTNSFVKSAITPSFNMLITRLVMEDETYGWFINSVGHIFLTQDGGQSWQQFAKISDYGKQQNLGAIELWGLHIGRDKIYATGATVVNKSPILLIWNRVANH